MPSVRSFKRNVLQKLESAYAHITLNKTTTIFFLLAFVHCLAQGVIQSTLFSVDSAYTSLITSILDQTTYERNATTGRVVKTAPTNLTFLRGDRRDGDFSGFVLKMCRDIPHGQLPDPCAIIFQDGDAVNPGPHIKLESGGSYEVRAFREVTDQSVIRGVDLFKLGQPVSDRSSPTLSLECTKVLDYPRQLLNNARREDLTLIFIQFWLFGVSVAAILNDSIPHTLSVLLARTLITGWSAYAIWRTDHNRRVFDTLFIGPNTPCNIDLWPEYAKSRFAAEIPDLILNLTALCLSCCLSWTLVKTYNQQSFKCMGPPPAIVRIYRFFMAVLVCLQLGTFFLVAAMSLWTDQMFNTAIGRTSEHVPVYEALVIGTIVLLLPWIALGWNAIRHERKLLMVIFLGIAFIFLSGWSLMFYSIVYRWSLQEWPFLLSMTVFSFVLIVASMVLGVICWLNFNKGLAQYLHAEAVLASSNFAPSVFKHDPEAASQTSTKFNPDTEKSDSMMHAQNLSISRDVNPVPTYYLPTLHSRDPSPIQS